MTSQLPTFNTLGAILRDNKLQFSIFSRHAKSVRLYLFSQNKALPTRVLQLSPSELGIWSIEIDQIAPTTTYLFEVDGELVLDPYAKAITTSHVWGAAHGFCKCQLTFDHVFDWQDTKKPHIKKSELIIYEMHVRHFTKHKSSKVSHPGTYLGMIEKIPYLKSLGINAVELLPIHEFDEKEDVRKEPITGRRLWNGWGYMTVQFFCPMKRYATSSARLAVLKEFKTMVREFHKNGIEVILDVVYNHVSLKSDLDKIDKESYFILSKDKKHTNYSGCGNTLSANSEATSHLMLSSLKYFAEECQIDGFRFDLGGCFARGPNGDPLPSPPIFELLTNDPVLKTTKLFFEPWDCGGINLLQGFSIKNCSTWNGSFKYAARRFIRGDAMQEQFFKDSFLGSSYLFPPHFPPSTSVNYVTCHDGFSLKDLVSYNQKHNLNNGELNRDGEGDNSSYNYGVEGKTKKHEIIALRSAQMKNLLFANLLSLGVPMIRMGDETEHSNLGNNNTYCQDELCWIDWNAHSDLLGFIKELISLRKSIPLFKFDTYLKQEDIEIILMENHALVLILQKKYLIACNASYEPLTLTSFDATKWYILLKTCKEIVSFNPLILPRKSFLIACAN